MSRSKILSRIQKALKESEVRPTLPSAFTANSRVTELETRFEKELVKAGGSMLQGKNRVQLELALRQIFADIEPMEVVWENILVLEKLGISFDRIARPAENERSSGTVWFSRHSSRCFDLPVKIRPAEATSDRLASVDLSVSSSVWGIAETGTVVECTAEKRSRVLPVLPPAHVSLLSVQRLAADLADFLGQVDLLSQGSSLTLVTGPSRTADIEKTLVLGVHGPGRLWVILTP